MIISFKKLKENFKVDGIMQSYIRSYLQGRQEQVVTGGVASSKLPVVEVYLKVLSDDVPPAPAPRRMSTQDSILGPLLFVLLINDMFSCVTPGTNILGCALFSNFFGLNSVLVDHIEL